MTNLLIIVGFWLVLKQLKSEARKIRHKVEVESEMLERQNRTYFRILLGEIKKCVPPPVAERIAFIIDGVEVTMGQVVNADKQYDIKLEGRDQDGNNVPMGQATLELSDPSMGEIKDEGEGKFSLNPNKTGDVQLIARAGEKVGTLDLSIEAGALFSINVSVSEKAPAEEPSEEQPSEEQPSGEQSQG